MTAPNICGPRSTWPAYLDAVLEKNDPALLAHALGVVARAKGMTGVAEATGRSRAQLYRSLSEGGNRNSIR